MIALMAPMALAQAPETEASPPLALAVSADAAAQALDRGAVVMDIRPASDYAQGHLPGAVSVPEAGGAADRAALQQLVSSRGIDLSREVLVVGQPGDTKAQRLQAKLMQYATGRVNWLVGGIGEWTLSGRPLATSTTARPPVPQHLVPLQSTLSLPRMAGASLRDTARAEVEADLRTPSSVGSLL
jgi:thiosulfate/3-mercaptopyruvate sulfurtransferase